MGYNYNDEYGRYSNENYGYKEKDKCKENYEYEEKDKCKENHEYKEKDKCKENYEYEESYEYKEKDKCKENYEYEGNYEYKEKDKCKEHYEYKEKDKCKENYYKVKNHNHEFESSTDYAGRVLHNHRIAGVTGPPIKYGKSHIHKVAVLTDTFGDHFHKICDTTGPALYLPGGKHIHLLKGETSFDAGHDHDYYFTTLIEDPTNVPEDKKC